MDVHCHEAEKKSYDWFIHRDIWCSRSLSLKDIVSNAELLYQSVVLYNIKVDADRFGTVKGNSRWRRDVIKRISRRVVNIKQAICHREFPLLQINKTVSLFFLTDHYFLPFFFFFTILSDFKYISASLFVFFFSLGLLSKLKRFTISLSVMFHFYVGKHETDTQ